MRSMRSLMTPAAVIATISLFACGDFEIVVPDVLSAEVVPAHGSVNVSRDVEIFVFFSTGVADRDSALDDIVLECLGTPPCQQPTRSGCLIELPVLTRSFDGASQTARLVPDTSLQADTCFVVRVEEQIEAADANVGPIPAEIRSSFQTIP